MNAATLHRAGLIGITIAAIALGVALMRDGSADSAPPARVSVSYADLDINTVDGAAVLYHRIRVAAAQVCAIYDSRDPAQQALRQSCTERAVIEGVAAVDNPVLSDRYLARAKDSAQLSMMAAR
jgi:UrcA family protein